MWAVEISAEAEAARGCTLMQGRSVPRDGAAASMQVYLGKGKSDGSYQSLFPPLFKKLLSETLNSEFARPIRKLREGTSFRCHLEAGGWRFNITTLSPLTQLWLAGGQRSKTWSQFVHVCYKLHKRSSVYRRRVWNLNLLISRVRILSYKQKMPVVEMII